jgi:hypothetical protein
MEQRKLGKVLGFSIASSEDMNKLADTVKGILIGLSSVIIFVASLKGIPISEAQVLLFAKQAGTTIGAFGAAVGAITTLYGLLKKAIIRLSK